MRILVDLEAAQVPGRHDLDCYALSLACALARHRGNHEIVVALNGGLPLRIEAIRAAFEGLLPRDGVRAWQPPSWPHYPRRTRFWRDEVARQICAGFLARLAPDMLLSLSLPGGLSGSWIPAASLDMPDLPLIAYLASDMIAACVDAPARQKAKRLVLLERVDAILADVDLPSATLDGLPALAGKPSLRRAGVGLDADADAKALLDLARRIRRRERPSQTTANVRPRLAYLSPLPPQRTGIAAYSIDLLPALAEHYEIELVVPEPAAVATAATAGLPLRSLDWFQRHAARFDRVLYHFGNSPFHAHMFDLLARVPGVAVLHEVYLGHVRAGRELQSREPGVWTRALYAENGYLAVRDRLQSRDVGSVVFRYPCSAEVVAGAQGIILHSAHALELLRANHGPDAVAKAAVVPMARTPPPANDRVQARQRLGIGPAELLVCSFGALGPTKLGPRILKSWLGSELSAAEDCRLVFVGNSPQSPEFDRMRAALERSPAAERIAITGWIDEATYRDYLAAADVAVQLRSASRGETSAAALDCLNHGLATVVSAHGAFAELPPDVVWTLPDPPEADAIATALITLREDAERRARLGSRAAAYIRDRHDPRACARQYVEHIERFYRSPAMIPAAMVGAVAALGRRPSRGEARAIARAVAISLPPPVAKRRLLLDVTATRTNNLYTGIERATRALARTLLTSPPASYRVEPIYLSPLGDEWHYRRAPDFALGLLGCTTDALSDDPIDPYAGDLLLGLDFSGTMFVQACTQGLIARYREAGVQAHFLVYDLLPVRAPEYFPAGADQRHAAWLRSVATADGAVCISRTVAAELRQWLSANVEPRHPPFRVDWFHLGADLGDGGLKQAVSVGAAAASAELGGRPRFLMVGTVEPRKGYLQVIDAFDALWARGLDIDLVIVGREGWARLAEHARQPVRQILDRLQSHPEFGRRLIWHADGHDGELQSLYASATCLIAASADEGFGLPLVEAARHGLPVIARDIPVFREVGQCSASYFAGTEPAALADAIANWLRRYSEGSARMAPIAWQSWDASAAHLMAAVLGRPPG